MVGIPLAFDILFISGPTLASVLLSFTDWAGIGQVTSQNIVGVKNHKTLFTGYAFFWPTLQHNLIWLAFLAFIATPLGMLLALSAQGGSAGSAGFWPNTRKIASRTNASAGGP